MDTPVFHDFRSFLAELESIDMHQTEASPCPVLLDVFSGVHAPLSKAFLWCQWEIITPIDIEIDQDLDVSRPAVRRAIQAVLPRVATIAGAMSWATKSRAREKRPGPPPLRSEEHPRGLPGLDEGQQARVDAATTPVITCWLYNTGDIYRTSHVFARTRSGLCTGGTRSSSTCARRMIGRIWTTMHASSEALGAKPKSSATTSLSYPPFRLFDVDTFMTPTSGARRVMGSSPPSTKRSTHLVWSSP